MIFKKIRLILRGYFHRHICSNIIQILGGNRKRFMTYLGSPYPPMSFLNGKLVVDTHGSVDILAYKCPICRNQLPLS